MAGESAAATMDVEEEATADWEDTLAAAGNVAALVMPRMVRLPVHGWSDRQVNWKRGEKKHE